MSGAVHVEIDDVVKVYGGGGFLSGRKKAVRALAGVSLSIKRGTTFALVGESGCGKSTLGKLILRLETPTQGRIAVDGLDYGTLTREESFKLRRSVQAVLQDPFAAMNPRQRISGFLTEPMGPAGIGDRRKRLEIAEAVLAKVGIRTEFIRSYPHEFSGGQRQRIAIARALTVSPEFLVLDEPVSALDVSVRAQILNLLRDLQDERGLTYLFISHDLAIVEFMADRVGVMYLGRLVEIGGRDEIFAQPMHPYTRAMLELARANETGLRSAAPVVRGEIPSPSDHHPGCPYSARCQWAVEACRTTPPQLRPMGGDHAVACHRAEEIASLSPVGGVEPAIA
jgi:oligopeptide/dipeptide ABC transporter ATP-binding protein